MQLGEVLGERLASVPVLSTILRVDLRLSDDYRDRAIRIVQNWVDRKRPSLKADWTKRADVLGDSAGYQCSFAEGEGAFALSFEHPDSRIPERSWVVETSLEPRESNLYFATRLSIRQPKNCILPEPRAPRILSELIQAVTVTDAFPLAVAPQRYQARDLVSSSSYSALLIALCRLSPSVPRKSAARCSSMPKHSRPCWPA